MSCTECASLQTAGTATKAKVPDDMYILKSTVKLKVNSGAPYTAGVHGNCYVVNGTAVVQLVTGCSAS